MVYKLQLNNTEFVVHVFKKGGRTEVFKNKSLYFKGQYFPNEGILKAYNFKFSTIIKIIENSINARIKPGEMIFPYYSKEVSYET